MLNLALIVALKTGVCVSHLSCSICIEGSSVITVLEWMYIEIETLYCF